MATSLPSYIVLSGPTASGKTSTAINLATAPQFSQKIEIVNFDSLLFYTELNIGTAKPSHEEQAEVPHHLIDITSISNTINASSFVEECEKVLQNIWSRGYIPLLTGGSGFYLKALIEGMYPGGSPSEEVKNKVRDILKKDGLPAIIELLKEHDPKSLENIHPNDEYRLTRALEFFFHTGQSISIAAQLFEEQKQEMGLGLKRKARGLHLHLDIPKSDHLQIIAQRTQSMLQSGLIEETQNVLNKDYVIGNEKPLLSIGYKEVIMYLNKNISNIEDLAERINISTRQLAKAQRTWFNNNPGDFNFDSRHDFSSILTETAAFLAKKI